MNFLAHHIISILQDNIYYNIGLTLPDLLSLQNRNCKVTLSFCDNIIEKLGIAKIAFFEEKEDKDTFTRKISLYKDEVLDNIVEFVKKELLDSLNFCSHENVSVKFDKNIIENIHNNMNIVLQMSRDYFK